MSEIPKYLEKIIPFFKEGVDFTKIKKPTEVLDFPITDLRAMEPQFQPFFDEVDIKSIKDLAQFEEPLLMEGLDPDEIAKVSIISEMIFWKLTQIAEFGERQKKIVLFGLGNAGKTSALTALSEKYSSIKNLLPTRGLVRQSVDVLGYSIMAFDMGGQEEYQKTYFEKPDMYFSETDLMIFCIDIQDSDKYDDAITYLDKILEIYGNYNKKLPVLIVFTKVDPDIVNDEKLNQNRIDVTNKIEFKFPDYDIAYTNSSIYERNSLENLFSLALKRISTSGGVIQELLRQYVLDVKARACTLISSSGLVFGSYGETESEEEMLNNTAAYLQNLYLFHISQGGLQPEDFYMMEYKRNNLYFISEHITDVNGGMIYLWVLTNDLRSEVIGIPKFREEIMPLINIFI
jgi:small GTP-binding protein